MKEVNIISKVVGRSGAEASPSSAILPNMSGYATKTELNTLRNEFKDFLEGADADVVINKWQDLVLFLEGISEDFDLISMLGLKADKSELSNYVTLATKQTITGEKNFTGGLKVNGSPIVYDATNKYWKLEGDLLVTGGVTMYASDSAFTPSTIMDAIATDNVNLKVVNGVLTFVGKTGGGVADSVLWDNVEGKPSWIGSSKPSYSYSEISGTPTLLSSFINDLEFVSKGTTLSHYGITNAIGYSGSIIADKADAYNLAGYGTTGGGFPINGGAIKVGQNNYQMILQGRQDTLRFNTVEAGTLKKWRKVWHDGNFNPSDYLLASNYTASDILAQLLTVDGSGSGLDADLLDGYDSSNFIRCFKKSIDINTPINDNNAPFILRIGNISENPNTPYLYANILHVSNTGSDTAFELLGAYNYDRLLFRRGTWNAYGSGTIFTNPWKTIAFTDSNVASATKLETARTIWGQSFDGTSDIPKTSTASLRYAYFVDSEGASNVGFVGCGGADNTISLMAYRDAPLTFGTKATEGMRLTSSGNVLIGTTEDIGYKLVVNGPVRAGKILKLLSSDGVYDGSLYFSEGDFVIESSKIGVDYTNLIINRYGGNVGIGTANPTYKLEVNGTLRISDTSRFGKGIVLTGEGASYSSITFLRENGSYIYLPNNLIIGASNDDIWYYFNKNNMFPYIDNAKGLGTNTSRWRNIYSVLGDFRSNVNVGECLFVNGIPIYKSQDDVLYIDGNLAVRGGITMYATDAIDVPSIIDALPIASASAKGIAAFNPNDFSIVDGYVSFIGKGGVDESVLADYAKKSDLSKYLPLSGGRITGDIGFNLSRADTFGIGVAAAGSETYDDWGTFLSESKSFMGSFMSNKYGDWWNIISARHYNGFGSDGSRYGMYLTSNLTAHSADLMWNRQYAGNWQGERVILDSVNWKDYVSVGNGGISGNFLTVDGSDYRGGYPALRIHIPNVNWQQFLMRGDGIVELRYGDGGQSGRWGQLALGTIFFDDQRDDVLYFPGKEYFDNHGNMHIPNADGSWSWNIYNSNGSNVMTVYTNGNIISAGGITMYSDIRKKTKLQDVELSLKQIADAPLIEHYYNSDENRTTHVGSIAQYWAGLNDWFCKLDGEGFYTMEIQNAALASAISIARELVKYESKTDRKIRLLKERVKELEDKIEKLENN